MVELIRCGGWAGPLVTAPTATAASSTVPLRNCHDGGGDTFGLQGDHKEQYETDQFRMFEFKVKRCAKLRAHDWTDCPFSHPGEKARRRDPQRFSYSGETRSRLEGSGFAGCVEFDPSCGGASLVVIQFAALFSHASQGRPVLPPI